MSKILIAYYSRKGQNYVNGNIKNLDKGNTEIVAEFIQKTVGGDLFEIDTVKKYAEDYTACTVEAKEELKAKARPELKKFLPNIDEYDAIFIGYPCWWGTMPMACFTFLERYDTTNKKIIPFCTHEGSGLAASEKDIKKTCPKASVVSGLAIRGANAAKSEKEVAAWAKKSL